MIKPAKQCRYCLSSMPRAAAVCASCGRNQPGDGTWIVVLGGVIAAFFVVAAISEAVDDPAAREATAQAESYVAAVPERAATVRGLGIDPLGGKRVVEIGLPPSRIGNADVRCATVVFDPEAKDPEKPPYRRAVIVDGQASIEPRIGVRDFNAVWRTANCGG